LDPQYRLIFGSGGDLLATPDLERMEDAVARLSPNDRGAFTRFMTETREKFVRFAPFLEKPFERWTDLANPDLLKLVPLLKPWKSLDSELGRFFSDERIRLAFTFQSKYLGMSPFRCPSLLSILSFLEYEHGVFHPIGGCGEVSATMARIAEDMGVEIHYGESVESMEFHGRRITSVTTPKATYKADATVVNADFARAMTRLVPDNLRRRWNDKKIASRRFSCSTFMLYLGLDGCYESVPHHNIYLAENYRENLADIERRHRLSSDPSMYVQNASITDPTLAPPRHEHALRTHSCKPQAPEHQLEEGSPGIPRSCDRSTREDWHHRCQAADSIRKNDYARRLARRLRNLSRSHLQFIARLKSDASHAATQSF
ncbi:MAG: phytoene desaturase, partial [Pirellulales bacterium]|nr:phytoene desaturase [Pirellulales bacterium]